MSTENDRVRIQEAISGQLFAIFKPLRGYYGKDAKGYWGGIAQAWHIPKEQALKYAMYADSKPGDNCYHERVILEQVPAPNYFEDANSALQICEFMRGKGFTFECMCKKDGTWNVAFWAWRADKEQPERYSAIELANQPAAICAAFCQFLDSEKGDGR